MGIIRSGILSKVSGKVAGVVGASWKDKAYLRAWVAPANPNTAAQQAQREKFGQCVAFAKPLLGQVIQEYWDPFQKKMSGFNAFIKFNIDFFPDPADFAIIDLCYGTLSHVLISGANYVVDEVQIVYTANPGNNGLDTDKVFAVVYDKSAGQFYFAAAETARSDLAITVPCVSGLTASNLTAYTITSRLVGSQRTMVGWSSKHSVTTP
jgi:hypothetical protein